MDQSEDTEGIERLLVKLRSAEGQNGNVSITDIQRTIGSRSFGPFLLLAGLIQITPIGAIPGVPTMLGLFILLTAGQVLLGRRSFWLPRFLTDRTIGKDKLERAADTMSPVAKVVDKILKPRLSVLTRPPFIYVTAGYCCLFALAMPPLEFVPFGGAVPASAVAVFGLALVFHDGLLVLLGALLGTAGIVAIVLGVF